MAYSRPNPKQKAATAAWKKNQSGGDTRPTQRQSSATGGEGKGGTHSPKPGANSRVSTGPAKQGVKHTSTRERAGNTANLPHGARRGDESGKSASPGRPSPVSLNPKGKTIPAKTGPPADTHVAPFLTPAQQGALTTWETSWGVKHSGLERQYNDATFNAGAEETANQRTHDIDTSTANQNLAARGLFQSSIRAGDLNDIDATLATRNNILNTNLQSTHDSITSQLGGMDTDWATTHNMYNQFGVTNAQGITPSPSPNPSAPPPAGTKPPAQPKPAPNKTPAGNTISRRTTGGMFGGQTNVPNPYGANLASLAAALAAGKPMPTVKA